MGDGCISAAGVSVSYGDISVLEDVDFACNSGEFVAIVGKSGAGKSSCLKALAGLIPSRGKIHVPSHLGYVFQEYALFPWMTVRGNIEFGLKALARRKRRDRVAQMLKKIHMADLADRYPCQLSGGQVQRVALARALAPDPDALLMDEPYGAIDHHTRERMQDWLLSIWRETRKTVLFVTHYVEEAIFLADRIVVVRDKHFVADLDVPFSRPRQPELRFSDRLLEMKHKVLDHMEPEALQAT